MIKKRPPQLALRLDLAAPDPAAHWRDGARLAYLGGEIVLKLDTQRRTATLEDGVLHLPLPPEATARQIQDGAETWLRKEAARLLAISVAIQARAQGRSVPPCSLSFAARASWVQPDGRGGLRCNWRLVELPLTTIEQVIAAALAKLPPAVEIGDLFVCAA
jgi:predicted metal-dependent hydrolase